MIAKSTAFKLIMLLVYSYKALAIEPIDLLTVQSKSELTKKKELHKKFFDMVQSGTLSYSLENNAVWSSKCFHNTSSNQNNCTIFLHQFDQSYARKKCENILDFYESKAENNTKIMSVDANTGISFSFYNWTGNLPEQLFINLKI